MASPRRLVPAALLGLALLLPGAPAQAEGVADLVRLSSDRVDHFREALRAFFWAPPTARAPDLLVLEERWQQPGAALWEDAWDERSLRVPFTRDLAFEEEFLVAGREDDYESAARHWVEGTLKGRGPDRDLPTLPFSLGLDWDHGPWAGLRAGPVRIGGGEAGWRVRWRHRVRLPSGGFWSLRVAAGEDDGEHAVRFSLGRKLRNAWR